MRIFARIEAVADNVTDPDEQPAIERVADTDLDVALIIREVVARMTDEHGHAWEADIHIEPLVPREDV